MHDPSSAKIEFYRDTGIETAPGDIQIHLLSKMPKEDLNWYCDMLVTLGDLLITTGARLKSAAQPVAHLSQETS